MKDLKELRIDKKMTQQQVADLVGISLRSYKSYENEEAKRGTAKYNYIVSELEKINPIDEEHGILLLHYRLPPILEIEDIVKKCSKVFKDYDIKYCYLFGSYAKATAKHTSDVDLLISTNAKGLEFYALVENIRTVLHKKVDVLDSKQLNQNPELTEEILKDGIKIYG